MITIFNSMQEPEVAQNISSAVLTNEQTNTFEFILDKKPRTEISETLTIDDRRELTKTRLKDESYFEKAKRVYAAGGGIDKIHSICGKSLSYAEKVHAAFERACK